MLKTFEFLQKSGCCSFFFYLAKSECFLRWSPMCIVFFCFSKPDCGFVSESRWNFGCNCTCHLLFLWVIYTVRHSLSSFSIYQLTRTLLGIFAAPIRSRKIPTLSTALQKIENLGSTQSQSIINILIVYHRRTFTFPQFWLNIWHLFSRVSLKGHR